MLYLRHRKGTGPERERETMNTYAVHCTAFKPAAFGPMRVTAVVNVEATTPGVAAAMAPERVTTKNPEFESVNVRRVKLIHSAGK